LRVPNLAAGIRYHRHPVDSLLFLAKNMKRQADATGTLAASSRNGLIELSNLLASGSTEPQVREHWTETRIGSTGDLVRIVECCHHGSYQYRGQECADWGLLPKLTREDGPVKLALGEKEKWEEKEQHILEEFRTRAPRYEQTREISAVGNLELAIWAQHHGAPTRLLDWTLNPLAALFFAVENENVDCEAAVWAIDGHRDFLRKPNEDFPEPKCGVKFVMPTRFFHRSAAQASILAVWGDPNLPFDNVINSPSGLWKIIVAGEARHCIRWSLHCLGINRETLFPDMDGLGRYLTWKHGKVHEERYLEKCVPYSKTKHTL
jgi:hypothetical protein